MKTILSIAIGIILIATSISCNNSSEKEKSIRTAIEQQLTMYPDASLCDVYKSFFQDQFGPGHLISDTAMANQYLLSELESCEIKSTILYEPTGYLSNFYRVNLYILKEGKVPYQTFFNAFLRSANAVKPISIEEWNKEWQTILSVIESMDINLKNFDQDKEEISNLLQSGEYVVHHSQEFIQTYDPHYRIIEKKIFEKEILPLINQL